MLHKGSKIIILDDEYAVAEFTSTTLEQLGFIDIEVFTSAKLFVDRIRSSVADIFFIDINLNQYDGLVILSWVKAKHPKAKVVMFSGDTREDFVKEATELGAAGFLSKFELDKNIRKLFNKWNVNYPLK